MRNASVGQRLRCSAAVLPRCWTHEPQVLFTALTCCSYCSCCSCCWCCCNKELTTKTTTTATTGDQQTSTMCYCCCCCGGHHFASSQVLSSASAFSFSLSAALAPKKLQQEHTINASTPKKCSRMSGSASVCECVCAWVSVEQWQ